MINYKIATNKDFFQVETDKQGGGVMTATYPRLCQAVAVSDNGFQILEQNGKIFLYNGKIENTKIEGLVYTDVYLFVEKLNEIVYNNVPAVSSTPSTTETLLQEIADSNEIIADNTSPNPIVTTLAINDTIDSGSSIPYNQIPFTGIVLGDVYVLTAVGLPTETIHTLSITENDKVNLNVENATATDIVINTTITIIAVKQ